MLVNGIEIRKFKAKDSEIVSNNLSLGNLLKDFSASNMRKTGFNGHIYDVGVDYDSIDVNDIKKIHKYLMKKKWDSVKMRRLVKRIFVSAMMFSGCNLSNVNSLECVSLSNKELK